MEHFSGLLRVIHKLYRQELHFRATLLKRFQNSVPGCIEIVTDVRPDRLVVFRFAEDQPDLGLAIRRRGGSSWTRRQQCG